MAGTQPLTSLLSMSCCVSALAGLNFLSVYAALSLAHHTNNSPGALALAVAAVGLGAFKVSSTNRGCVAVHTLVGFSCIPGFDGQGCACSEGGSKDAGAFTLLGPRGLPACLQTWLRVFLGFHTWPQVLVGAALGAATAVTWLRLGTAWALPALQASPAGLRVLYTVTALGSAAFGYKVVTGWFKEQRRKQQLSGKVKIAVDTFAEEEFEELTKQLAQQQEVVGGASGPCEREQHAREGLQSSSEGGSQPAAGATSNFAI